MAKAPYAPLRDHAQPNQQYRERHRPSEVPSIGAVPAIGTGWVPLAEGLDRLAHRLVAERLATALAVWRPDWVEYATRRISGAMDQAVRSAWARPSSKGVRR